MNFLVVIMVVALICIMYFTYTIFYAHKNIEKYTNVENRLVYNLFKNNAQNNGTFGEFKNMLKQKNITFSNNDEITFDQYMELFKRYNKGILNINDVDNIRIS